MIYVSKLRQSEDLTVKSLVCELTADSRKELDEFAARLGLLPASHYVIGREKRDVAVKMGAIAKE